MEFTIVWDPERGEDVVLIRRDEATIGTISNHKEGIIIASEYLDGVTHTTEQPPSTIIRFVEGA